ncbi:MAG: site-2 protease family protein [Pedobacter sp.]|jgi:Zn-dependent protease
MQSLADGLLWYFAFILSVVVHEASHALAAFKLGDRTAYEGGQVTIDPIPHIKREPLGTVLVPVLSYFSGGWMFGWASAPYDRDWARRHPDRSALMSLAGPLSNLLLVIVCCLLIRLGMALDIFYAPDTVNFSHITAAVNHGITDGIASLLSIMFSLNLILFCFNLLPLPPLDGSGIVPLFLSRERAVSYLDFIESTPLMFLGLLFAWNVFGYLFDPIHLGVVNLLYPGVGYH